MVFIFFKTLVFSEYHISFSRSFEIFCSKIKYIFYFFFMCIFQMIMTSDVFITKRTERPHRIPIKSPKVAPFKQNIGLFLYSSTITVASPKVMTFFRDHFFWNTKMWFSLCFSHRAPFFVRPSLITSIRISVLLSGRNNLQI